MKPDRFTERIRLLTERASDVSKNIRHRSEYGDSVDDSEFAGMRTSSLSFIRMIYGEHHSYYKEFEDTTRSGAWQKDASKAHAILKAIQEEIEDGWLFEIKDLVAAELFGDFVSMAEHLIAEGYKDPGAVIVGSVLEEHLRQLCNKHKIVIEVVKDGKARPKKAESLNVDLAKKQVYTLLDQKSVTAWLDLRNKAAHGKYEEYTIDQVILMKEAVVNFISRTK